MYRALIAAAAFAAISVGAINACHAQEWDAGDWNAQDQYSQQPLSDDVQGQPTDEETEGRNFQGQERYWVWYRPYCWSRWVYVGYNGWGRPVYRRYVWCR